MQDRLFELDGQWIKREPNREAYYRYWYDGRRGRVRRASLKTADFEEAKRRLAAVVVEGVGSKATRNPDDVLLLSVIAHYLKHDVPTHSNPTNARRAFELLTTYLFDVCKYRNFRTSDFTLGVQQDFMEWCAIDMNHSASGIARNMNAIRAAVNYCARPQMVNVDGRRSEVQLLQVAPTVQANERWILSNTSAQESAPRDWLPSFEQLAELLDQPAPDYLARYDILALYTWARPEAIWDLNTSKQVDADAGLIDMNPVGRKQNNKFRPVIRLCDGLAAWLGIWARDYPLRGRTPVFTGCKAPSAIRAAFRRRTENWRLMKAGYSASDIHDMTRVRPRRMDLEPSERTAPLRAALEDAESKGYGQVTMYTLRHFMATRVRGLKDIGVDREQREIWLGHRRTDTTSWYESFDPEFLREVAAATDMVVAKLDDLTDRRLMPRSVKERGLRIVSRKEM